MRRIVYGSGIAMLLVGLVIIATLAATAIIRSAAATGWLLLGWRQLRALAAHNRTIGRIRIHPDGRIETAAAPGDWRPAVLRAGSVVLDRVAWLRLDRGHGPASGELLRGNCRKNEDWRRLQMIWRHLGRAA